ncbi:MFS transporter [Solirubrobacter phytolaccae]|uniref:MFS transporter n=1 Tax=Solirubrobacter phytolaccae TaxID=1404360 RepID=A0A9X3N698_9ACTN|nr:MFS transporter [Solirubrobacter phytolaccae]MDA0179092.1 MFS transporter [Solirubrobacter phytolaccae]
MRRYLEILRSPYVGVLVASSLFSRLPIGINALAIVLYLREQTGSFAVAGGVSGALAFGSALGAPVQGRLVDRMGARRVLLPVAVIHAMSLGAIVGLAELDAPTLVLLACGWIAGFAVPPTSSVLRSMWTDLVEPRLHQAAYALDSTMIELIFISGPLLTAIIAAITSPAGALIVSAIAVVVGTAIFTALPPTRHVDNPDEDHPARGFLGALAAPGVRMLVITSFPTGVGIGMLEVGIPAFSRAEGAPEVAGVLLAMWSFGSLVGGLAYGMIQRRSLHRTHLVLSAVLPLTLLPLAASPSVWVTALLVLPAGCCIAPLLATRNELVGGVAPPGMRIEAYTWPITSFVGGIAAGAALCGVLVEGPGWRTAFVVAGAIALTGALAAILGRQALKPPARPI